MLTLEQKTEHARYMREWRLKNIEHARDQDRQRSIRRREQKAAYDQKYRANTTERRAAQHKQWVSENRERHNFLNRKNAPKYKEKMKETVRNWYLNNRERVKETSAKWREANRDLLRKRARERYHANHDQYLAKNRRRRDLVRGAKICDFTGAQWTFVKEAYSHRCAYCGNHSERLTIDHVIPISKGGDHTLSNIVPACRKCNYAKSNKTNWKPNAPYSGMVYR